MRHRIRIGIVVICTLLSAGCCPNFDRSLPDGIRLLVSDAATDTLVQTDTLWATAQSASYVDTQVLTSIGGIDHTGLDLVRGRPGIYNVRVEANGYEPWERKNVWLRKSGLFCNSTEEIIFEVKLQPIAES